MTVLSTVWINSDQLAVKFGKDEAAVGKVASFAGTDGELQVATVHFDFTDVILTSQVLDYNSMIMKGSRIHEVRIWAETVATSGGAAALNLGLVASDFVTPIDADGLIAALPIASLNVAGEQTILTAGVTNAGALIGTTLAQDGWLIVDSDTDVYTAGKFIVEIRYYKPVTT